MKRILLSLAALSLSVCMAIAAKPVVRFNNGELKILQLTDTHLKYEAPEEYTKTAARIDHVIKSEAPDFIVITGDVVTGNRETRDRMWDMVISRLDSYKIPYAITFGNHDYQGEITRPEMSAKIVAGKYNVNTLNEIGELADIRIPVASSDRKAKDTPLDIYVLDSHAYCKDIGFNLDSYAWFTQEQVNWLRNECEASTAAHGGAHVPSLAFFHIPLVEYNVAWAGQAKRIGVKGENGGEAKINTGMFAAMFETGNMMGVFAGHDHDSNYIIEHFGIALGYGGYSGDDTTYNHLAHGLRLISVKEGAREFTTWIHEEDDRIQFKATYKDGELTKIK